MNEAYVDLFRLMLTTYGPMGLLAVVIVILVHDPNKAEKLQALVLQPTYRLFRWSSQRYLASKVGSTATEFLRKYIKTHLPSVPNIRLVIKWVQSPSDPILEEDGTVILKLEETDDQTRNILAATRVALPHIVCPSIRQNLESHAQTAIDLALLRKLVDKLGRHARPVFQKHFLAKEVESNQRTARLFADLVEIDRRGIFVPIFLEELNRLGESLYAAASTEDKTESVRAFLEFLLVLARREVGEWVVLDHITEDIRVSIVLVARSDKAQREGTAPYLRRINSNLKKGCDSIYLIAFPPAFEFFKRVLGMLRNDDMLWITKVSRIHMTSSDGEDEVPIEIALLRRNAIFSDVDFEERVRHLGIREGEVIEGTITDASRDMVMVDVRGITAELRRQEADWMTIVNCAEAFRKGGVYRFVVKVVNRNKSRLELSRKFADSDPWRTKQVPDVGDRITIDIVAFVGTRYLGRFDGTIDAWLPREELAWLEAEIPPEDELVGTQQEVIILAKNEPARSLVASVRRIMRDPWPAIHQKLPKGTELRGTVKEVSQDYVKVELPEGLIGHIPRDAMIEAAHEYADFVNTVVVGQGLDVVVSKVFIGRQRIRLDLRRNVQVRRSA